MWESMVRTPVCLEVSQPLGTSRVRTTFMASSLIIRPCTNACSEIRVAYAADHPTGTVWIKVLKG